MDKFQVYNRTLNTWEDDNIQLISGWSENFVLDKTTDSAKVKLKYKGNTIPNWNKGDWCRILHLSGSETGATYENVTTIRQRERLFSRGLLTGLGAVEDNVFTIVFAFDRLKANGFEYSDLSYDITLTVVGIKAGESSQTTTDYTYTFNARNYTQTNQIAYSSVSSYTISAEPSSDYIYLYNSVTAKKPLNNEQYLIKNITMIQDNINGEIDVQLELEEPINMANGIVCETMSHTNQTSKVADSETYLHDSLNHLSVLEKVLKVTPANNDEYNLDKTFYVSSGTAYYNISGTQIGTLSAETTVKSYEVIRVYLNQIEDGYGIVDVNGTDYYVAYASIRKKAVDYTEHKSWASRIRIADYSILENKEFNDETYNEPTLYNILLDKFDSSLGRTPVMYFDLNNDLPRNTERAEYFICFERQDGFDKEETTYNELVSEASQIVTNKSGENFADGLISNYDNLSTNKSIYGFADELWVVPEIDSNTRTLSGYTSAPSEFVLKLPHLIKKVTSLKRYYIEAHSKTDDNTYFTVSKEVKDFSGYLFEEKQYNASGSTYFGQTNSAWYKEGSNLIHINEVYFRPVNVTGSNVFNNINWVYKVTYEPLISGRFDLGRDYQEQINQVDSQVDNAKFGKYLKEYLASMNKADIIVQKTYENYTDIKEIGTRVGSYIITNVSIQSRKFVYDVVYQLNENHIRKNDSIQAPQEIRKNIEISVDATKERKSMLNFGVGLSYGAKSGTFYKTDLSGGLLTQAFKQIQKDETSVSKIQLAKLKILSTLRKQNVENSFTKEILCELARYYLNDTICFNMKYLDNAEAGKSKTFDSETVYYHDMKFYSTPKEQIPILYTDIFGEFEKFNIDFLNINNVDIETLDIGSTLTEKKEYVSTVNEVINSTAKYPEITALPSSSVSVSTINNINYYKDMLDTFNYTIGIHYNTDNNIILSNGFFEKCHLLLNGSQVKKARVYDRNIIEDDILTLSSADRTVQSVATTTETIDGVEVKKETYSISGSDLTGKKSIAIFFGDEIYSSRRGKLAFIINNLNETGNTFSIYHS